MCRSWTMTKEKGSAFGKKEREFPLTKRGTDVFLIPTGGSGFEIGSFMNRSSIQKALQSIGQEPLGRGKMA